MRRELVPRLLRLMFPAACPPVLLVLLVLLTSPPVARADGPMLALRQAGGESAIYAVSGIEQIVFDADTLVVLSAGGADRYPAGSITRIEFLWDFSAITNPEDAAGLLKVMRLFQNRPNPFSPETRIAFDLPQTGRVEMGIYTVDGRLIRALVSEELTAGTHEVTWDGRDAGGQKVAGGVYYYSLVAPGVAESRRMILVP